ncbi:MAG: Smr/MutS family protein [Candidatus Rifleibacteriota bacterium]
MNNNNPVEIPVDGTLDLHNFRPAEVKNLVIDYLQECRNKNIFSVRIIHGKGIGNLRRTVHSTLKKLTWVESFELAGPDRGHWGATIVKLKEL